MRTREEAIDDMILALMYLTRFNDGEGRLEDGRDLF